LLTSFLEEDRLGSVNIIALLDEVTFGWEFIKAIKAK
jgi:hypothetical protein